jgi:hypothetical protein
MGKSNDEDEHGESSQTRGSNSDVRGRPGRLGAMSAGTALGARSKPRADSSPAGLSLRGPRAVAPAVSDKVTEKAAKAREHIEQAKQTRQQSVWDKLDAARSAAANRQERLHRFNPRGPKIS